MLKVILAKSYDDAKKVANSGGAWVAVETEYGVKTLGKEHQNVALELNHHGEHQNRDAPALAYKLNLDVRYDNFIISHIDLDVLFGILWTAGWLKKTKTTLELSKLVALADTEGFHIAKSKLEFAPEELAQKYYAIGYLANSWVINDDGKNVKDVSKEIHKLLLRIKDIILGSVTSDQIQKYNQWFIEQDKVAKLHLKEIKSLNEDENLFVYRAPFRLTTAYSIDNIKASIIVQYNEQSKSISLSCFDTEVAKRFFGPSGVITPLKKYFGKDAGGKNNVGGTSRSHDIQPEMLQGFLEFLYREYLNIPEVIDLSDSIAITGRKIITMRDAELYKIQKELDLGSLIKQSVMEA